MPQTLAERLLAVAAEKPTRECLVQGDRRVSFGEIGALARHAADWLRGHVAAGDRVALLMDNGPEYVATLYGTWLAGGVTVGLNTALRAEDLADLIRHSGSSVLAADPGHPELKRLKQAVEASVEVVEVAPRQGFPGVPSDVPRIAATRGPEELATIIYTSGTTGHPKGVMLSHRNLAANTDSICAYLDIRESDRALCVLPFYYSYGASVLHTHLVTGAALVLENSFMYPHPVLQRMVEERATSLAGVPSTFYLLLKRTDLTKYDWSAMRYVTQAGGRMDPARIDAFCRAVPHVRFVVMYGQTEATARLAYLPPDELARKPGSAGKAIPGVRLSVRGAGDRELEPNQVGEVCAQGENVMMGYWAAPEDTAEVLSDGWLHTGDIGYMDEDGFLFLEGRRREMIKSGAHRIAPMEIEDVIREVPGVDDVAVVGESDDLLGEAVRACVLSRSPGKALSMEIRRACKDRLPGFKIPKTIEFFRDFPRTASGKVRKHLL